MNVEIKNFHHDRSSGFANPRKHCFFYLIIIKITAADEVDEQKNIVERIIFKTSATDIDKNHTADDDEKQLERNGHVPEKNFHGTEKSVRAFQ